MSFGIPNEASATHQDQAEIDAQDIAALVQALNHEGVITGLAVTAQGTPDMTVAVASGSVVIAGTRYNVTGANGTVTAAHATNPRFDLVTINTSSAIVVVAGTAAAQPVFPSIPASQVLLAAVYVPATDTTINSTQIIDKRCVVPFYDRVRAIRTTDTTVSTGSDQLILWDGESYDTNTLHSTSANTGRITIADTGIYRVETYLETDTAGTQTTKLRLGGSTILESVTGRYASWIGSLSATNYVEAVANVSVTGTLESDTSYFAVTRVP